MLYLKLFGTYVDHDFDASATVIIKKVDGVKEILYVSNLST